MVAVIYAAVRAAAFSRAAAQIKMGENSISLCRIVNGSEAGLASSCCQPAAPLAAAMCGNSPGCAARTAAGAARGLVVQVADALDALILHEVRDGFDHKTMKILIYLY